MSLTANLHFNDGVKATMPEIYTRPDGTKWATLSLSGKDDNGKVTLFFDTVGDIESLVIELNALADEFADAKAWADLKPGETEPGVPPWPVAPGTDTTGWSVSQQLGEQPPPNFTEAITDDLPIQLTEEDAGECRGCKRAIEPGKDLCEDCEEVAAKIEF